MERKKDDDLTALEIALILFLLALAAIC